MASKKYIFLFVASLWPRLTLTCSGETLSHCWTDNNWYQRIHFFVTNSHSNNWVYLMCSSVHYQIWIILRSYQRKCYLFSWMKIMRFSPLSNMYLIRRTDRVRPILCAVADKIWKDWKWDITKVAIFIWRYGKNYIAFN